MSSSVGMLDLVIVLILFALAVGVPVAIARRSRRRGPLPTWARATCAAIGLALVAGVFIGTASSLHEKAEKDDAAVTIQTPTLPVPEIRGDPKGGGVEAPPQRLLIHCLLAENRAGETRYLQARTLTIRWPEDKNKSFSSALTLGDYRFDLQLEVDDLKIWHNEGKDQIKCAGTIRTEERSRRSHSSGTQLFSAVPDGFVYFSQRNVRGSWNDRHSMWSLVNKSFASGGYVVCVLDRASLDDPLKESNTSERLQNLSASLAWASRPSNPRPTTREPPVVGWIGHFGPASLILCVAAVLLSLVLPAPRLAVVALALAVVFTTVGLDSRVNRRLAREAQSRSDEEGELRRADAAVRLSTDVFFYRDSARNTVQGLLRAPDASETFKRALLGDATDLFERVKTVGPLEWRSIGLTDENESADGRDHSRFSFTEGTWPKQPNSNACVLGTWMSGQMFLQGSGYDTRAAPVDSGFPTNQYVPLMGDWWHGTMRPSPGDRHVVRIAGNQQWAGADTNVNYFVLHFTGVDNRSVRFDWARLK